MADPTTPNPRIVYICVWGPGDRLLGLDQQGALWRGRPMPPPMTQGNPSLTSGEYYIVWHTVNQVFSTNGGPA